MVYEVGDFIFLIFHRKLYGKFNYISGKKEEAKKNTMPPKKGNVILRNEDTPSLICYLILRPGSG